MTDRIDDEAALEEVLAFLDQPPEAGSPDDARFAERLRQVIAASIPADEDATLEDTPALKLDEDLRRRLEMAARQRGAGHYFGDHPDGIGPTLGMDVSNA